MILQIEDCKYYVKNGGKLKSGRIPSSDSMLLLAAYFNKSVPISKMLQKFIACKGTAKCTNRDYSTILENNMEYIDYIVYVKDILDARQIGYRNGNKVIQGISLKSKLYADELKLAIFEGIPSDEAVDMLEKSGWKYFVLDKEVESGTFEQSINQMME